MRISHKHKFVFISIPRTGSESVRAALTPYSDITSSNDYPYHHHTTAPKLKAHFDQMGWDWNSYFKFTFVRNPWDRLVSYYLKFMPDKNMFYAYNHGCWNRGKLIDFTEWIQRLDENTRNDQSVTFFQKGFVCDEKRKLLLDFVGRFENLNDYWRKTVRKLGI